MKRVNEVVGYLESLEELFVRIVDDYQVGGEDNLYQTRSRVGIFAPALVMWLTISQRLQSRHSLAGALESFCRGEGQLVRSRNDLSKKNHISQNTGGLCKARERLQLEQVQGVSRHLSEYLIKQSCKDYRWRERTVVLIDGTTVTLSHAAKILDEYKPIKNQHRRANNPQLLCLCAHELFTSVALPPQFGPYRGDKVTSEIELYHKLVSDLPQKSLIIADRLFGNFPVIYRANQLGHQVLLRLSDNKAKGFVGRRDEDFVEEVSWSASKAIAQKYPDIVAGAAVTGRIIRHTVKRDGFRPLVLLFFTTSCEPAHELVELYLQRERIENDIRSLKYLMGLEMITSKSPDIVAKELLLTFAAYNLMRGILAKAALALKINPRQISFSRAANLTQIFGNKLLTNPSSEKRIVQDYLTALSQIKHPNRKKRRVEPRKCARRRQLFPLMKKSREEERSTALNIAKEYGHRSSVYPHEKN